MFSIRCANQGQPDPDEGPGPVPMGSPDSVCSQVRASHHPPPPAGTPVLTPLSPAVLCLLLFELVHGRPLHSKGEHGYGGQGGLAPPGWLPAARGATFTSVLLLSISHPRGPGGLAPVRIPYLPMPSPHGECGCGCGWGAPPWREQKWGICWELGRSRAIC